MEKHVLSDQTGLLSGQNLSLARQMTRLLTKNIGRLVFVSLLMVMTAYGSVYKYRVRMEV